MNSLLILALFVVAEVSGQTAVNVVLSSNSTIIQSPNYPRNYPSGNYDNIWRITSNLTDVIRVISDGPSDIYPNCGYDFVQIQDVNRGTTYGPYCSKDFAMPILLLSASITIRFKSSAGSPKIGFRFKVDAVDSHEVTPGTVINLQSGNYPGNYPNLAVETWPISAPGGSLLRIDAVDFSTEASLNCRYDYLEIQNRDSPPFSARYCGQNGPKNLILAANSTIIQFVSDGNFTSKGFNLAVEAYTPPAPTMDPRCGQTDFQLSEGVPLNFTSPNFPEDYSDQLECAYTFTAPQGKFLKFDSMAFSIEAGHDYLAFHQLDVGTANAKNYTSKTGPRNVRSINNQVIARFHTDSSINGPGFEIIVQVINCTYDEDVCPNDHSMCIKTSAFCNRVKDCPSGVDEDHC